MKKPTLIITVVVTLIIVLSVVQVVVSNRLSTTGIILEEMSWAITTLQIDNATLSERVLTASSLTNIASRASSIGFVEGKSFVRVTKPLPLARKEL